MTSMVQRKEVIVIMKKNKSTSKRPGHDSFIGRCITSLLLLGNYCEVTLLIILFNSHHAWCSFEAFAELYNEMVRESCVSNFSKIEKFIKEKKLEGIYTFIFLTILIEYLTDDVNCGNACLSHELFRKIVSEMFWNAEVEAELRESHSIDKSNKPRENLMSEFDEKDRHRVMNTLFVAKNANHAVILLNMS